VILLQIVVLNVIATFLKLVKFVWRLTQLLGSLLSEFGNRTMFHVAASE